MNKEIAHKNVALDSISQSVEAISQSLGVLTKQVDGIASTMVTKDEMKDVSQQVRDLRSDVTVKLGDFKVRLDGITLSMDDLPTRKEFWFLC